MRTTRSRTERLNLAAVGVLMAASALLAGCGSDDEKDPTDYPGLLMGARKKGQEVACEANLHNLGVALQAYAARHQKFPATLEDLAKDDKSTPKSLFQCPANGRTPYLYIPPASMWGPTSTIVARDSKPVHRGKVNVLYRDSSVRLLTLAELESQMPKPTTQPKKP